MEDADGLSFDFEGGLDSGPSHSFSPGCSTRKLILRRRKPDTKLRSFLRDGSRSWKRTGLPSDCLQTLASRSVYESRSLRVPPSVRQSSYAYLPVLPVTRECREQDCVYKHTNADIKECNMYVLLFDSTLCNESDCVCFLVWSCRVMKAYGLYLLMQWMRLCLVLSLVLLYWQVQAWVLSEWFWLSVQACEAVWTSTSSWGSSSEDTATDFLQSWA